VYVLFIHHSSLLSKTPAVLAVIFASEMTSIVLGAVLSSTHSPLAIINIIWATLKLFMMMMKTGATHIRVHIHQNGD